MTKYREIVEKLGEANLEIQSVLDDFPVGSTQHDNDRFNTDRWHQGPTERG